MELDTFWQIVEDARGAADPVVAPDEVAHGVVGRLSTLAPEQIVDFDLLFQRIRSHAFRWDVWGAAWLINDGCSDDGFLDFLGWLAAQGRKVWETTLADPDSLAAVLDRPDRPGPGAASAIFCEPMAFAASRAHEAVTGDGEAFWTALDAREEEASQSEDGERRAGPSGDPIDFDDAASLRARLPRLSRLYPPA